MDLPTYTNIWRIEKKLYKLYDFRLPQPVSVVYIGVVVGVGFVWVMLLRLIGVPLEMPLHVVYIVPPFVIAFLATRPVVEGKRLSELIVSQIRFTAEPRVFTRLRPEREPAAVEVTVRVWHRDPQAGPLPAVAADAGVRERGRERGGVPARRTSTGPNRTAEQAPSLAGALPSAPPQATGGPAEEEGPPEPLWDDAIAAPKASVNGSRAEPLYPAARTGASVAEPAPAQEPEPAGRERGAGAATEPEPVGASAPAPAEPPDLRGEWERDDGAEPRRGGARRRGVGLRVLNYFGFALDRQPGRSGASEHRGEPAPGVRRRPARGPVSGPVPGAARTPVELAEHLAAAEHPSRRERPEEASGTAAPASTAEAADAPAVAERPEPPGSSARRRAEEMMAAPAPAEPRAAAPPGADASGAETARPAAEQGGAPAAKQRPQRRLRGRAQGMEVARRLERERSTGDASAAAPTAESAAGAERAVGTERARAPQPARPAPGDGAPSGRPSLRERRAQRRPHAAPWDLPVPLAGADADRPDAGDQRSEGAESDADGAAGRVRERGAPGAPPADARRPAGAAQDGPWAADKPALELDHGTGEHENLSGVVRVFSAPAAPDVPSTGNGHPSGSGDEGGGAVGAHGPAAASQNGGPGEAKPPLQLDHGTDEHESLSGVVGVFAAPSDGGAPERTDPVAGPAQGERGDRAVAPGPPQAVDAEQPPSGAPSSWADGSDDAPADTADRPALGSAATGTAETPTAEPAAGSDRGADPGTGVDRADGEPEDGRDDGRAGAASGAGAPSDAPDERLSVLNRYLSRTDTPAPRPPRFAEAGGHEPRRPVAWFTDAPDPHDAPAAPGESAPGPRPDRADAVSVSDGRPGADAPREGAPEPPPDGQDAAAASAGSAGRRAGGEPVGDGASDERAPSGVGTGTGGSAERVAEVSGEGRFGEGGSSGDREPGSAVGHAGGADTAARPEPSRESRSGSDASQDAAASAGSAGRRAGGEPVGGGASDERAPSGVGTESSATRAGSSVGDRDGDAGGAAARPEPSPDHERGRRGAERSGRPEHVAQSAAGNRSEERTPSRKAETSDGTAERTDALGEGTPSEAKGSEAENTPEPASGLQDARPAVGRQSLPPLAGPPVDTGRTSSLRGDAATDDEGGAPEGADTGASGGRTDAEAAGTGPDRGGAPRARVHGAVEAGRTAGGDEADGAEHSAVAAQGALPPLAGAPEESGANAPVRSGAAAEDALHRGGEPDESGESGRYREDDRPGAAASGAERRTGDSAAAPRADVAPSVAVPAKPPLELDHGTGEHESFGQVDAPDRRTTAADLEAAEAAAIRARAGRTGRTDAPGDADGAHEPTRDRSDRPDPAAAERAEPGRAAADRPDPAAHPDRSDRLARTIRSSPTGGSPAPARDAADDGDRRNEGGDAEPDTRERRLRSAPAARVDDGVFSRVAQNARRLSHLFGQTPPGTPPDPAPRSESTTAGGTAGPPDQQAAERPGPPSPADPAEAEKPELQLDHGTGEQEGMGRTAKGASAQQDRPSSAAGTAPGDSGATRGWRRLARVVTGGSAAAAKSDLPAVDIERLRTPLPSPRNVVVLGCTGGAGQTVTTLMLGHTLAAYRDERVVAVDVNPGSGGLSRRIRTETPETVTSLLANADRVHGYAAMRRYTSRAATGLEVVATLDDPYVQTLDDRDYAGLAGLLERFYEITVLDPAATGVARSLPAADGMVLVAPASEDAARAVAMTFEWLDGHGYSALRSTAVVVINGVSKRSLADVDAAEQVARGRCRAIVRVPWDDHLAAGKVVDVGALRPTTRRAHGALGGVLVRGMDGGPAPSGQAVPGGRRRSPSETRG
ncbi:hypothetical protein GCM10023224_29540 [Streptomonospora halophila]|uniref:MinD-like ATPase involved in chromosome partitioning or flagellar assembly n=1 Tax=Streptomonospora halophila TaxID=427369 RepID=A0ABP9GI35_9ACTN